ncbi:MAG TPA: hypothetical protein VLX85_02280 [Stellaceae bacterium]|nr:hypothetical protein [Stellaceae bacterium]
MSSLAETINSALAAVGPSTEVRLRDLLSEFGELSLSDEDRLSALATVIAATAATHHRRHMTVYLEAVKTWSLEIAEALEPAPMRFAGLPAGGPVEDGAEILISGLDNLIDSMTQAGVRVQDRLVTELAVVARLLGQHDANTIHFTLMTVARALADRDYQPGEVIYVPLRETIRPLSRDAQLEALAPRGFA